MQNCLVTGGAGVIGSFLVKNLAHDCNVNVIDDLSSGEMSHISELVNKSSIRFKKGSVTSPDDLIETMKGVDTVFHLAANGDVRYRPDKPNDMDLNINTIGTYNVLEAMRKMDVPNLIFSSTSSVYGLASKVPTSEDYGPLFPESLYGSSKLAAEGLISAYSSLYGIKASIFRFANIVAPISRTIGKNVIPDFIDKLKATPGKLLILGDGNQRKSYLYVDDCIDGMLFLSGKQTRSVDLFNLGTVDTITVNEIADIIMEEMNLTSAKREYTGGKIGWKGDVPLTFLDISKAKKMGWAPKHNSAESVRLSARGLLNQGSN
jgi:UDP-glucose 4-epimerase